MELDLLKIKGKDIKLVVFDLDGTLLNSQSKISYHSKLAINELKKRNIKIAIASGRIFTMLKSFYEDLGLNDFVISSNGAAIDDLSIKKPIMQLFTDPDDSKKVVEYCVKNHIECNILKREACYFQDYSVRLSKFNLYNEHAVEQNSEPIRIVLYEDGIDHYSSIEKILIYETNTVKTKKIQHFVDQNTKLNHMTSGQDYVDISAVGVSKGEAVKKIAQYMNISMEQVCVFGDYDNDISMLDVAGIGVVMSNGTKNTLKHADFITLSNDEEGIAYAIKELLL